MKTYYKMYGLNFTEVTPKEYADLNTVNDNTLYIVAPDQYNNYIEPAYSVELYLGSVRLGAIKSITDDVSITDLDYGFYEIRPAAADKNKIKIAINLESHIEFKNVSSLDKSYIFINQYTRGSTSGISITTSGDVTIKESNSTSNNYSGMVAINLSNNNGNISIIKDSIKSLENSEQQINKVDTFELNNTSSKTYPSTKAVAGLVSKSIANVERTTNKVSDFELNDTSETTYPNTKAVATLVSEAIKNVERTTNKVSNFELNDTNENTYPNTKAVASLISDTVKDYEKTSNRVNSFTKDNASTGNYPSTKAVADFVVATVGNIDSGLSTTVTQIVNRGGYIGKRFVLTNNDINRFWRDEYIDLLAAKGHLDLSAIVLSDAEISNIENTINNNNEITDKSTAIETAKSELLKSKQVAKGKELLGQLAQRGELFNCYDARDINVINYGANVAFGEKSHARGAGVTAIGHYAEASGYMTTATSQGAHAEGVSSISIANLDPTLEFDKDLSGRNKPKIKVNQFYNDLAQYMIDVSLGFGDGWRNIDTYNAAFSHYHADIDPQVLTEGYIKSIELNGSSTQKGKYHFGGALAYCAHTEGSNCLALGGSSHAEGFATRTYSNAAHVEGAFSKAHGSYSHAEGLRSYSYASATHAEGIDTHAHAIGSHAEGAGTRTNGDYSHAEGYKTTADGKSLSSPLDLSINDNFSIATGLEPAYEDKAYISSNRNPEDTDYAIACDAWALGWSDIFYSRLLAKYNNCVRLDVDAPVLDTNRDEFIYLESFKTYRKYSGQLTDFKKSLNLNTFGVTGDNIDEVRKAEADEMKIVIDNYSVIGSDEHSWATEDSIELLSFIAKTERMNAIGIYNGLYKPLSIKYNDKTYTYMYQIDYAYSEEAPQHIINAAEFADDTNLGRGIAVNFPYIEKFINKDGEQKYRFAHPFRVAIDYAGFPIVDTNVHMYLGQGSHTEGYETQTSGNAAHAEGYRTFASAYSHAEGCDNTTRGGQTSHVEGSNNHVNSYCAHAEGKYNLVSGGHSHAEGDSNTIWAVDSHAEGASNVIDELATYSHVGGRDNRVYGECNFVHGRSCSARGYDSVIVGRYGQAFGSAYKNGFTLEDGKTAADMFVVGNGDVERTSDSKEKVVVAIDWYKEGRQYIRLYRDLNEFFTNSNIDINKESFTEITLPNTIKLHKKVDNKYEEVEVSTTNMDPNHYIRHGVPANSDDTADTTNLYMSVSNLTGRYFAYNGRVFAELIEPTGRYFTTYNIIYSQAFKVAADGNCYSKSAFNSGTGADYAEYYEWEDGNPNNEDRVGHFVTFGNNETIRIANSSDDYILGAISANPVIVGNSQYDSWQGKYLTDIYGRYITEDVEIPEEVIIDDFTKEKTIIPAHIDKRFVINPNYDQSREYIPREFRPEWSAVGTHGRLILIDDGSCQINKYCKVADDGTATHADEKTDYRVVARIDDNHIKIVIK